MRQIRGVRVEVTSCSNVPVLYFNILLMLRSRPVDLKIQTARFMKLK